MVQPRRPRPPPPGRGRHVLRRLGPQRPRRAGGGRLQLLGRAPPPGAAARHLRPVGAVPALREAGRQVQVRDHRRRRAAAAQGRPVRLRHRGAARHGQRRLPERVPVERRRVAGGPGRVRRPPQPPHRLRMPPRLVADGAGGRQPAPHIPGTGRAAAGLPDRARLHPRRVPAGGRAPVLPVVGLPGVGLLRPHRPFRHARRLPGPGRRPPRGRHRCAGRLGPGPLPEGRFRPGPLRRHGAVRAR